MIVAGLTREQRAAKLAAQQHEQQAPATATAAVQTVAMVRDAEQFPRPHTADVHPAEVENYRRTGWRVKE